MKVQINFLRFQYYNGRTVAYAQLFSNSKSITDNRPLAQLLKEAEDNDYVIENAQEILDMIIREKGFAS